MTTGQQFSALSVAAASMMAGGSIIRCAPYALFGTEVLSENALAALIDRKACLLANHGMIALGVDLDEALTISIEVGFLCEQYWRALQIGEPVLLSDEKMQAVFVSFKKLWPLSPQLILAISSGISRHAYKSHIRTVPHYPKQGILFYDITTLFKDPAGFRIAIHELANRYTDMKIDKIAGIESRGFILGAPLAYLLGVGFVPEGIRAWAAQGVKVRNPAFDATPAESVTELITVKGVVHQPNRNKVEAIFS